MRLRTLLSILTACSLAGSATAQIRMLKVDESTAEVTIRNFSPSMTIDVSSYWMCRAPGFYQIVSSLTLVSGDLMLSPGEEVTYVYGPTPSSGGIGLYHINAFTTPSAMSDYVQYKGVVGFREPIAVLAGLWTAGTFASGAMGPYYYSGDGLTDIGAAFWTNVPPAPPSSAPALSVWGVSTLAALLIGTVSLLSRRSLIPRDRV